LPPSGTQPGGTPTYRLFNDPGPAGPARPGANATQDEPRSASDRQRREFVCDWREGALLGATALWGFTFWHWVIRPLDTSLATPGLGLTLWFILGLAIALGYFALRGIKPNARTAIGAGLLLAGALPFAVFAWIPYFYFLAIAECLGLATWAVIAARHSQSRRVDSVLALDALNQAVPVPVSHLPAWLSGLRWLTRGSRHATRLTAVVLGLVVGLPLIGLVTGLLAGADASFARLLDAVAQAFSGIDIPKWLVECVFTLPVAAYVFALLYANARSPRRGVVTEELAAQTGRALRRVGTAALAAPVGVLCGLYVAFFGALSTYLFSAFSGHLPDGWTYADYARAGFFQLFALAVINLLVLGALRLFARRPDDLYPRTLRVLGAVLSALTVLLVVTGVSKMLLYIGAYGLTRLRVFILVLLVVMFVVFTLFTAWHVRPFALSRAIAWLGIATILTLAWGNTDGVIAAYNLSHFGLAELDITYLRSLSDAVVPTLEEAGWNLWGRGVYGLPYGQAGDVPWTSWNWQSAQAAR
jgi:hypothetical protein